MNYSKNYNLALPVDSGYYSVKTGNNNFERLDELFKIINDQINDLNNDDAELDSMNRAIKNTVDEIKNGVDVSFDTFKEISDYINTDNGQLFTELNNILNNKQRSADVNQALNKKYTSLINTLNDDTILNDYINTVESIIESDLRTVYNSTTNTDFNLSEEYNKLISSLGDLYIYPNDNRYQKSSTTAVNCANWLISQIHVFFDNYYSYRDNIFDELTGNYYFLSTIGAMEKYINLSVSVTNDDDDNYIYDLTFSINVPHNVHYNNYVTKHDWAIPIDDYFVDNSEIHHEIIISSDNDFPVTVTLYLIHDPSNNKWSISDDVFNNSIDIMSNKITIKLDKSSIYNWTFDTGNGYSVISYMKMGLLYSIVSDIPVYKYLGDIKSTLSGSIGRYDIYTTSNNRYNANKTIMNAVPSYMKYTGRYIGTGNKYNNGVNSIFNLDIACILGNENITTIDRLPETVEIPSDLSTTSLVNLDSIRITSNTTDSPNRNCDGLLTQTLTKSSNYNNVIDWSLTIYFIDGSIYQRAASVTINDDNTVSSIDWNSDEYIKVRDSVSLSDLFDKSVNTLQTDYYLNDSSEY